VDRSGMTATLAPTGATNADGRDDADLLTALRDGDEAAFAQLVDRYHGALVRLARLYVSDAAAEDVVQETWLGFLRGLSRFEARASLKTWLFRILVNRARTRAVRDGRTMPLSTLGFETEAREPAVDAARFRPADDSRWPGHWLVAPAAEDLPEERFLAGELTDQVRAAVARLPPAQRQVVMLRDIQGLSSDEVCDLLQLTDANQRVLLHRGRSKVRAALEAYCAAAR
jgi:RNA polymerase sigma-70 factor, ECF subfamily